jgi:hypothetical protein
MTAQFTKNFDTFVCEGDSIACTVDGINFTARLVRDYDETPHDLDQPGWVYDTTDVRYGEESRRIIEAWDNDEWHYFGVVIDAEKAGVTLDGIASLWGIEGNFPGNGTDNPNLYFRTVANELLDEAISHAKERFQDIADELTNKASRRKSV